MSAKTFEYTTSRLFIHNHVRIFRVYWSWRSTVTLLDFTGPKSTTGCEVSKLRLISDNVITWTFDRLWEKRNKRNNIRQFEMLLPFPFWQPFLFRPTALSTHSRSQILTRRRKTSRLTSQLSKGYVGQWAGLNFRYCRVTHGLVTQFSKRSNFWNA